MERDETVQAAIEWAKNLFKKSDWVLLSTASVGQEKKAVVVQIAVYSSSGQCLFESLVRPPRKHRVREKELSALGIERTRLDEAPKFAALVPKLADLLNQRRILCYDLSLHKKLLFQTAKLVGAPPLKLKWGDCVKKRYEKYLYAKEPDKSKAFQLKLGDTADARAECEAVLGLLNTLAGTKPKRKKETSANPKTLAEQRRPIRLIILILLLIAAIGLACIHFNPELRWMFSQFAP